MSQFEVNVARKGDDGKARHWFRAKLYTQFRDVAIKDTQAIEAALRVVAQCEVSLYETPTPISHEIDFQEEEPNKWSI